MAESTKPRREAKPDYARERRLVGRFADLGSIPSASTCAMNSNRPPQRGAGSKGESGTELGHGARKSRSSEVRFTHFRAFLRQGDGTGQAAQGESRRCAARGDELDEVVHARLGAIELGFPTATPVQGPAGARPHRPRVRAQSLRCLAALLRRWPLGADERLGSECSSSARSPGAVLESASTPKRPPPSSDLSWPLLSRSTRVSAQEQRPAANSGPCHSASLRSAACGRYTVA